MVSGAVTRRRRRNIRGKKKKRKNRPRSLSVTRDCTISGEGIKFHPPFPCSSSRFPLKTEHKAVIFSPPRRSLIWEVEVCIRCTSGGGGQILAKRRIFVVRRRSLANAAVTEGRRRDFCLIRCRGRRGRNNKGTSYLGRKKGA